MRDTLPVRYMAISVDADLKDEIAAGESVMAGQAQLELDGAGVGVGVGLDDGVGADVDGAQLTCRGERHIAADEGKGLVAGNSRIGIDGGQIDAVQPAVVYALEVGDQVVVADPDARFVEVVEHERVIAQPAGHGVEPSAANDRVIAGATVQGVVTGAAVEDIIAASAGDDVGKASASACEIAAAGEDEILEIGA